MIDIHISISVTCIAFATQNALQSHRYCSTVKSIELEFHLCIHIYEYTSNVNAFAEHFECLKVDCNGILTDLDTHIYRYLMNVSVIHQSKSKCHFELCRPQTATLITYTYLHVRNAMPVSMYLVRQKLTQKVHF